MNFLQKMSNGHREELQSNVRQLLTDKIALRRAQAILMFDENVSEATIKAITGYKREVVIKLRRLYLKKGFDSLRSKRKEKAPRYYLKRSQKAQIVEVLNNRRPTDFGFNSDFWSTRIVAMLIEEQYGVKYSSKTSIYLIFKSAKFTFHKPEKRSEKRDQAAIDAWKKTYGPIIEKECARNDSIVFAEDEAVITSQTRLQKVWLPEGKRAFVEDTINRKAAHLYGFLNIQNGVGVVYKTSTQTGEVTVDVLKKLSERHPNKRIVIFWDNASWHKSKAVRDFLAATKGTFQLYNFPPYSPELNPQEHVWKELRDKVLNNKLITNIDRAIDDSIAFIDSSIFKYRFLGLQGTFNV